MKRFSIPFFLILGLVQCSFSQSEFLTRGHSGYGGGIGLSTNREENGLNFNAGFSYRGFLNANLTYSKTNGDRLQNGILSPSITFYPIKQEDAQGAPTIGLSLAYSGYMMTTTTTNAVPDSSAPTYHLQSIINNMKINAITAGATIQSRIGYWKVLFFQPSFGASMLMADSGWKFTLRGGVSIGTRVVHGPLLILTPSIESQTGLTTLMLTFGAVF